MRARVACAVLAAFTVWILPAAGQSGVPSAKDVVSPHTYVSLSPLPRGRAFQIAVVLKIRPGFHVNAREVLEDYLIPTDLSAEALPGFRMVSSSYPRGVLRKLPFSKTPLNVYEGNATLRMKFEALASAPLGPQKLLFRLHYQACSDELCLPPVSVPIEVSLEVAPAGTPARPVHPEVFLK
jgi:Disulphide bond corrector protein DsbC